MALPLGEDAEFLWVVENGAMARVRKADIVTMVATPGTAPAPEELVRPPPPHDQPAAESPRTRPEPDDFVLPPELKRGTLLGIIRQSGIPRAAFEF